jgi:hypothetical protein
MGLLDEAGWPADMRDIDNSDVKQYTFWHEDQSGLEGIFTFEEITGSIFYIDYRGYAKWESAVYRSANSGTPVATFNNTMHGFEYSLEAMDIWNHIIVRTRPPQVPETDPAEPTTEIEKEWKVYPYTYIRTPTKLRPDVSYSTYFAKTDTGEFASSWGTPVVECHFFASRVSAYPTVSVISQSNTTCQIRVTNDTGDAITVDSVSVTYVPLVEDDPIDDVPPEGGWAEGQYTVEVEDTASQAKYTHGLRRTKPVNVPFPMTRDDALALAYYYLNYFKDPIPDIIQVVRNDTEANLVAILDSVISDRITSIYSGADFNADAFINKEQHRVTEGGLFHEVTWTLEKADSQREIFIWDTSVFDSGAIWAPW